jgi:hypothetical protein
LQSGRGSPSSSAPRSQRRLTQVTCSARRTTRRTSWKHTCYRSTSGSAYICSPYSSRSYRHDLAGSSCSCSCRWWGLAGLSAAVLLSWRGICCLLVERHPSVAVQPRARGVNLRSMELRSVPGLEAELTAAGRAGTEGFTMVVAESVTGREFHRMVVPGYVDPKSLSPGAICTAGQDRHPVLLPMGEGTPIRCKRSKHNRAGSISASSRRLSRSWPQNTSPLRT